MINRLSMLLNRLANVVRAPHRKSAQLSDNGLFFAQNELELLLIVAAENPSNRGVFQSAVLTSDLLAATPSSKSPVSGRLNVGDHVSLLNAPGPDGSSIPALFTSELRLTQVFGPGTAFIRAKGKDLLELVAGAGAVLNPGLAYGVSWSADNIGAMLGRVTQHRIDVEQTIQLGVPANRPDALIAAFQGALTEDDRVAAAWFALAHWQVDDSWSWFLDLRSDAAPETFHPLISGPHMQDQTDGKAIYLSVKPIGSPDGMGIQIKG